MGFITGIAAMVPQAKRLKASTCFLAFMPNPATSGLTDSEWLDDCVEKWLGRCIKKGDDMLTAEAKEDFKPFE